VILVLLLVVVLLVAAGAGLLGAGVLGDGAARERTGFLAALTAPVVLVVGVVVLAVMVTGVGGMFFPGQEHEEDPTTVPTAPERPADEGISRPPPARALRSAASPPVVILHAGDEDSFQPYLPVSGLVPDGVVRVQAEGFGWHERGSAQQCVVELGRQTACGERSPVQFDADGRADFQFAIRADIAPGGCRAGQPTCLLRVNGEDSSERASVQTVLVDTLHTGQVRLEPATPIADGQTVDVIVSGFPPGATATAVLCAPPELYDARRCGGPQPASRFTIDAGGTGRTTFTVAAGRLGADAALCGPRRACGIAVLVGDGFAVAPVTLVRFARGPGATYDAGRILPGVGIALVLIVAAIAIARRTDWAKPEEAATPELDGSDLRTGQSLDDLFGTDEELDERDPVPW
jgi:hypothetical protein